MKMGGKRKDSHIPLFVIKYIGLKTGRRIVFNIKTGRTS